MDERNQTGRWKPNRLTVRDSEDRSTNLETASTMDDREPHDRDGPGELATVSLKVAQVDSDYFDEVP
jgi:hypothetical protein